VEPLVVAGLLASAALLAVLAWRLRGRSTRVRVVPAPRPATPRAIPLVPVPDAKALAALPRPLTACPDCGYVGIRPARFGEGAVAGLGDLMSMRVCGHCGYRGPPVEFDDSADYVAYVEGLRRAWRIRP
jgi:hypothetical protein